MFLVSPTDRELLAGIKLKASAMSHPLPEELQDEKKKLEEKADD